MKNTQQLEQWIEQHKTNNGRVQDLKIIEFFNGELTKENYYFIAWTFSRACIASIAAMVFLICLINMD